MHEWENYFMFTGTGAVTLIGLLFVIITFGAERVQSGDHRLLPTYLTPTGSEDTEVSSSQAVNLE